jgi:phospholipid transport system substrate-binding protein
MRMGLCVAFGLLGLIFTDPIRAAAQGSTQEVKIILEQAMDIQSRPELEGPAGRPERARLIRGIIERSFLAQDMARDSLKDHWSKLNNKQQVEFKDLFTDLFQDSYTRMVLNYLRKETVEYLGETNENGRLRVRTKIMRVNEHIPVDYTVVQRNGRWSILDVEIDGVSIVGNYQNQFRRVIQTQSFDDLVKKMRIQSQAIREGGST